MFPSCTSVVPAPRRYPQGYPGSLAHTRQVNPHGSRCRLPTQPGDRCAGGLGAIAAQGVPMPALVQSRHRPQLGRSDNPMTAPVMDTHLKHRRSLPPGSHRVTFTGRVNVKTRLQDSAEGPASQSKRDLARQSYDRRKRALTGCSRSGLFDNVCPAASYSPTPSPVQYHRR